MKICEPLISMGDSQALGAVALTPEKSEYTRANFNFNEISGMDRPAGEKPYIKNRFPFWFVLSTSLLVQSLVSPFASAQAVSDQEAVRCDLSLLWASAELIRVISTILKIPLLCS